MQKLHTKHALSLACLLALTGCAAEVKRADAHLADGAIAPSANAELHSSYLVAPCGDYTCNAGYLIDQQQINTPALKLKQKPDVWLFPSSIWSVIEYQGRAMVNDADGGVYQLEYPYWVPVDVQLEPRSRVLWTGDDIVACTTPAPFRSNGGRGSCYGAGQGWQFDYELAAAPPAVCNKQLHLIRFDGEHRWHSIIDVETGRLVSENPAPEADTELCPAVED